MWAATGVSGVRRENGTSYYRVLMTCRGIRPARQLVLSALTRSVAGASAAAACRRGARRLSAGRSRRSGRSRSAITGRRRRSRRGCRVGRRRARAAGAARTTTEIGHIPSRPFELEPRSSHLLAKRVLTAFRALGERVIAHFLQHIFRETACFATIGIDRHGSFRRKKARKALNYNRFTRLSGFVPRYMGSPWREIKTGRHRIRRCSHTAKGKGRPLPPSFLQTVAPPWPQSAEAGSKAGAYVRRTDTVRSSTPATRTADRARRRVAAANRRPSP